MKIVLAPKAEKQLRKLQKIDQMAVARKIRSLAAEGKPKDIEKLQGFKGIYRVRVGNIRIVFKRDKSIIYIVLIGHRKEIYTLVSRMFR